MSCGIYRIRNIVNGKFYVGQAVDFKHRWSGHKFLLEKVDHHAKHLENAWYQYGPDKFTFEILEECEPITEILNAREQYWLDTVRTKNADGTLGEINHDLAYNSSPTAGSSLGMKHTEETRQKISEHHKRNGVSVGEKNPMFGKHHSVETKQKIGGANKGKVITTEVKQKMSVAQTGEKNHFFGKYHDDETLQKISLYRKGCIGEKNHFFGKHHSKDTKEKIRQSNAVKLSWSVVEAIRMKYDTRNYTYLQLADEYEVSQRTIGKIINNQLWKV